LKENLDSPERRFTTGKEKSELVRSLDPTPLSVAENGRHPDKKTVPILRWVSSMGDSLAAGQKKTGHCCRVLFRTKKVILKHRWWHQKAIADFE
jgi:hypothetical protein